MAQTEEHVVCSQWPDVALPDNHVSLPALLFAAMRTAPPAKAAIVDTTSGETLAYGAVEREVRLLAYQLHAAGLGAGSTAALVLPNCLEFCLAFLAIQLVGATVTTANPAATARELAVQLRDSAPMAVIFPAASLALVQEATAGTRARLLFAVRPDNPSTLPAGVRDFGALRRDGVCPPALFVSEPPCNAARDVAVLPYSSGTTGLPKGVMLSHRCIIANVLQMMGLAADDDPASFDVTINVLPMYHIYGMVVIMCVGLYRASTIVLAAKFELAPFLQLMQKHRVTRAWLVPPIVLALAKDAAVDRFDLSALRVISCGAAPLGESVAREVSARLKCVIKQGYGMTEASPTTHMAPVSDPRPTSVGRLLPNMRAKVVHPETGRALPAGDVGEICVQGPNVMLGYWKNDSATATTLRNGWLHTGDLGFYDRDGFFYVSDRLKELIKCSGFQVAPAELEGLLLGHPAVKDAAVVAAPHDRKGEVPVAFVVLKDHHKPTDALARELVEFCARQTSHYKHLASVSFVSSIPKTASGKILRRELRPRGKL